MDKKTNIVNQIVKAGKSHDETMAKLVVKAMEIFPSQNALVKALKAKGFETSQPQISRWLSIGKAIESGKISANDAEKAGKNLRQNKAKVSEVAKGKTTRKPQGKTSQVSKFDAVKKNIKSAITGAKSLDESEKAKLRDLTLELVSVLGVIPSADTLLTEFDNLMAELG